MGNDSVTINHDRMQDVVDLARIAGAAHPGGMVSSSQYLKLAAHYMDLRERLQLASGKSDDCEVVTMYTGPFACPVESRAGDPGHTRIVVVNSTGEERELYRGSEYRESEQKSVPLMGVVNDVDEEVPETCPDDKPHEWERLYPEGRRIGVSVRWHCTRCQFTTLPLPSGTSHPGA